MSERSRLCQKRPWLVGKRFFGLRACQGLRPCQKDQDHVREVKTMSERSRPCQKRQWIAAKRFFGLRACFTLEVKHTLTFICGGKGLKWGVQWVGPQGVSQPREGVGFWV